MEHIPNIRPVSDIRNKFSETEALIEEQNAPLFLTKNGHGWGVLMSMETYNLLLTKNDIERKLLEADQQIKSGKRLSHSEVFDSFAKKDL